jgi:hypothetical protein
VFTASSARFVQKADIFTRSRKMVIDMTRRVHDEVPGMTDAALDEPVAVEVTEAGKRVRLPPTRTLAVGRIVRILDSIVPESERARAVAAIVALYGAA